MSYIPSVQQIIDNNNSTILLLGIGYSFNGNPIDVGLYNTITITVSSDVSSAINGLSIQFSPNMETWFNECNYTIMGGSPKTINLEVPSKYFKLSYVNGDNPQTSFMLQTVISPSLKLPNSLLRLTSNAQGLLDVNVKTQSNKLTLIDQLDFTYGLNQNKVNSISTGAASYVMVNGACVLAANDNIGSITLNSKANFDYKYGQTASIIFACSFNDATSQVTKVIGVGNDTDGYFFMYSEDLFSIIHKTSSSGSGMTYSTPQYLWNHDTMNGVGNSKMLLDVSKGNNFKIVYPMNCYGVVAFYIMSQFSNEYILVHTINWINTQTSQLVRNTTLTFNASLETPIMTGSTFTINSMQHYIEGLQKPKYDSLYSFSGNKNVSPGISYVFSLLNPTTFNDTINNSCAKLTSMSLQTGTPNSYPVYLNLFLNAILDTPIYSSINSGSIIQSDTSGSNINGGTLIYSGVFSAGISAMIDLTNNNIILKSGDVISFCINPLANPQTGFINVNWIESTY